MKTKNHNSKNIKIKTRFSLAAIAGILLAVILISIFSVILRFVMPSFYNVSNVTTNSYSLLNQVQLSQAMSSISDELESTESDTKKQEKIEDITSSLEKLDTKIYISKNDEGFYSNTSLDEITKDANSIIDTDTNININYFGENGLVIVSHAKEENSQYTIIITNTNYTVNNVNAPYSQGDIASLLSGRTIIIILVIFIIFILSIILVSLITSKTITKPIEKMAQGANEIASGNLDYVVDYDSTNEVGTTVAAMNDMTKRIKQSINERDAIDASRKDMIAGVAHDLRTPLTSIKGYIEGLRDGIANTPEKQEQYLDIIYSSTLDMEKLLNELQTISRLELGKIQLEAEKINLNDFLNEYVEEATLRLQKKDYTLKYSPAKDETINVNLDVNRFSRVLNNILSNALKYRSTARKGKTIISVQPYEKSVIISLSDNGIGISEENLKHIFDTFFRADQARSRVSEGSGIGLSVCKEIVELHKGQIWATSEEGSGTTILISLERI